MGAGKHFRRVHTWCRMTVYTSSPPPSLSLSPISLCVPSQHVSDLCLTSEAISHPLHVCLSHLCPHQFHFLSCPRPGRICHLHGPDTRWGSHWSLLEPTNLTDRSYCSSMVNLTHRRSLEQLLCQWCLCWYYLGWHLTICFCWHRYADLPHWVLCCQGGLWLLWVPVCCLSLLCITICSGHLCRLLFILFCCCVLIIRYIYIYQVLEIALSKAPFKLIAWIPVYKIRKVRRCPNYECVTTKLLLSARLWTVSCIPLDTSLSRATSSSPSCW